MTIFKFQHPSDLISRLFILEYMKEVDTKVLYEKANKYQKELMFYKFSNGEDFEEVDINWEYCLFEATLYQLENFMKNFLEEIEEVEAKRSKLYEKAREDLIQEKLREPVDINIMDLAKTEIDKSKNGEIKLG